MHEGGCPEVCHWLNQKETFKSYILITNKNLKKYRLEGDTKK